MTYLDLVAFVVFVLLWRLLAWLIDDSPWHKYTLSCAMKGQRRLWMRVMVQRQNRIVDASIITGLQQATSFFASTALLAVGSGFALLTAADTIINAFELSMAHVHIDRGAFFVKVAALMSLYAYAFFKFGWSYRLFNYSGVMLAAVPDSETPGAEEAAICAGEMNIAAAGEFTAGLRAFFLAMGVLGWFVSAWAFMAGTVIIVAALLNRQFNSKARLVARYATAIDHGFPPRTLNF